MTQHDSNMYNLQTTGCFGPVHLAVSHTFLRSASHHCWSKIVVLHALCSYIGLLRCAFSILSNRKPGSIASPAGCIHHDCQREAVLARLHHLDELLGCALHALQRLIRTTASLHGVISPMC